MNVDERILKENNEINDSSPMKLEVKHDMSVIPENPIIKGTNNKVSHGEKSSNSHRQSIHFAENNHNANKNNHKKRSSMIFAHKSTPSVSSVLSSSSVLLRSQQNVKLPKNLFPSPVLPLNTNVADPFNNYSNSPNDQFSPEDIDILYENYHKHNNNILNGSSIPTSPTFFLSAAFDNHLEYLNNETPPEKSKITNRVRRSILIDYKSERLDDYENISSLKLLLLGSTGVGKSALLLRYANGYFDETESKTTIGIDLKVKLVDIDNKTYKVVLWDTAGQERYKTLTPSLYKDTNGILLVYDINNKQSLNDIEYWMDECIENIDTESLSKIVFFVVGNKRDKLMSERKVFIDDLQRFSQMLKTKKYDKKGIKICGYYEVSAKYFDDVKFLFRTFITQCVNHSPSSSARNSMLNNLSDNESKIIDLTGKKDSSKKRINSCCSL